jgi:hypothetical protein
MKKKHILYLFILFSIFSIWWLCSSKTKEKYILPNNYRGFFGVIYQADPTVEKLKEWDYRIFKVPSKGIYESGYRSAKGALHQEFVYQNGVKINSFGFQMLSYLKDFEIKDIKNNKNSIYAIWSYGAFVNGGENSVAVYFVGTGSEVLKLFENSEKVLKILQSFNGGLQENKSNLETYIFNLNQEFKEKKPPFD